jgi:Zn-dependent oligopeptidase
MYEFTMTKKEVEEQIKNEEAEVAKLQAEWQSLVDINKNGIKLTSLQSKRLSQIKKESSTKLLAIKIGKDILEKESYKK